ncbi:glycoside hydrolase family 25 protein [Corynebacterium sp. A21]|uniref:glycoside hydrolase family 25 protein n=1 Tax=Corynebacterium sp. A21 TaxID=3457318 RepID=UPI003FD3B09A
MAFGTRKHLSFALIHPSLGHPGSLATAVAVPLTVLALGLGVATAPSAGALGSSSPRGVDVSSWQHPDAAPINWSQVSDEGHHFAVVKATEGIGYVNPHLLEDAQQAAANGLITGTYHLARPGESATLQAAEYAAALATVPQASMPPVLDIEYHDDQSPAQLQAWTREFLQQLEALTGRTPIIYTNRFFWEQHLGNSPEFSRHPLWLAAYQDTPPTVIPGGWTHLSIWQHSDSGQVAGVNAPVDMNLFNGTHEQFAQFKDGVPVVPGNFQLPDFTQGGEDLLTQPNVELVAVVLAIAAGLLAADALTESGGQLGLAPEDIAHLSELVTALRDGGQLPLDDLARMVEQGGYTVGDLILLLESTQQPGI